MNKPLIIFFCILFLNAHSQLVEKVEYDLLKHSTTIYNKNTSDLKDNFLFLETVDFFKIKYRSDSLVIDGMIISPKMNSVFPVIIYNKGGNNYSKNNYFRVNEIIDLAYYTSKGYVIIMSNYRGKDNKLNDEFGGNDLRDIENLFAIINTNKKIDKTKIALLGFSRGAIMNYQLLKTRKYKISCSISLGGMTNLFQTKRNRPIMETGVYEKLIPLYIKNKRRELVKRSAYFWVKELPKIPYLILHGNDDKRISPINSIKMNKRLLKNGFNSLLYIIEDGNHTIRNKKEIIRPLILDFLDSNLK